MNIKDLYYLSRNSTKLKNTIVEILDTYERDLPINLYHFKKDLLPSLFSWVKEASDDISTWRDFDTDYPKIAHVMIIQTLNNILDNFRLSGGINLHVIHMKNTYNWLLHRCCKWALLNGYMSQAEYDDYHFND